MQVPDSEAAPRCMMQKVQVPSVIEFVYPVVLDARRGEGRVGRGGGGG